MDIDTWLRGIGLGQYVRTFRDNGIDLDVLPDLTERDLETLGLLLGHRRKLLRAIGDIAGIDMLQPDEGGQSPVGVPPPDTAERRHLTVIFVDLVGSTALAAELDPEEMREIIRLFQNTVTGEISRFEGHVAKLMGDGVLAYFGWPQAHEDEAERAVRAALSVTAAIHRLATPGGRGLQVRIGIATSLVVVGDLVGTGAAQERAIVGAAPNLAARLQESAEPGAILIADATRRLLGDIFLLRDLGPQAFKGIADPVPVSAVIGERPLESRFAGRHDATLAPVVGRTEELQRLQAHWRQARDGKGAAVLLTGDAGIGKSRIAEALATAIEVEPHFLVRLQCSPINSESPLYPIAQHLILAAGFVATDREGTRLEKLEALLSRAGGGAGDALPLMAALVGIDGTTRYGPMALGPQQRRNQTIARLIEYFVAMSRQKPLLLLVEDTHWIDPTTLDLIEAALPRFQGEAILLLMTSRPVPGPSLAASHLVARMELGRLGAEATDAIVSRVTRGKRLPAPLLAEIAAKTDGVPLFVEEMTKAVIESGSLHEGADAYTFDGPFSALSIPNSLQDSLMARLDRLEQVRDVAQMASVIGRGFDFRTLMALTGLPKAELAETMRKLAAAELVFSSGVPPDASYLFKHALVRDAAYESLLRSRRKQLHARLLQVLERDRSGLPGVKAQHAEAADLPEKAIEYWRLAASAALARPAYREAVSSLENCVRLGDGLKDHDPRQRYGHLLQIAQALLASQGYSAPSTQAAFEATLATASKIGDAELQLPPLFGLWAGRHIAGEPATDLAERFTTLAATGNMAGPRLIGLRILGIERFYKGQFGACLDLVRDSYSLYDPERHQDLMKTFSQDPRAAAGNYLVWSLWCLGWIGEAQAILDENMDWAQRLGHPHSRSLVLCYTGCAANILLRRPERVLASAREALLLAEGASHALWRAWSLVHHGWALAQANPSDGLGEMEEGLREARRIGARRLEPFHLGLAAEVHARAGDHPTAADLVGQAFASMQATQDEAFVSELYRVRGRLVQMADPTSPAAEADFRKALAIAIRQGAVSFQLRAARDLAVLLAQDRRPAEAVKLLLPLLSRFSPQDDCLDLREARSLATSLA